MDYPCPWCEVIAYSVDELYNHVLNLHSTANLTTLLEGRMARKLTRNDFTQVDSKWIYVLKKPSWPENDDRKWVLELSRDEEGKFRLKISGTVGTIPAATAYPTEPEWESAELLTNKFKTAFDNADW